MVAIKYQHHLFAQTIITPTSANTIANTMDDLDFQLLHLVKQTCKYPPKSRERQKNLHQIISLIQKSGRLLKANPYIYDIEDVYQKTWLYFCCNICENCTAKKLFNPDEDNVISWVNRYLHFRIKDALIKHYEQRKTSSIVNYDGTLFDQLELIPSPPTSLSLSSTLSDVDEWLHNQAHFLRRLHLRNHPEINCEVLIKRRLPANPTPWQNLAQEFGVSVSSLSSLYQRKCIHCLRKFGKSVNYLD